MLVLMRKPKESIRIGERIRVTLLKMEPRRVKVRIAADRNIAIDRDELPPLDAPGPSKGEGLGALVLTRHEGESIRIGESVAVTIVAIERNRVRIGVDAGPNVAIDREEVYFRKLRERGVDVDPVFGGDEFEEDEPAFEERSKGAERGPSIRMIWSGSRYSPVAHVPVIVKRRKVLCR
jgi:carbon storage regulator